MNVTRRFFRVTTGPVIRSVKNAQTINGAADTMYKRIISDIGANDTYYTRDHRLVAFTFDKPDRNLFKKVGKGWYPKLNTKWGKSLDHRIRELHIDDVDKSVLTLLVLVDKCIFTGRTLCRPTICVIPSDEPVVFVSVPWYDEDPAVVEEYKKSTKRDGNLDMLLWTPPKELIEVKEWEVDKEIAEWNSRNDN